MKKTSSTLFCAGLAAAAVLLRRQLNCGAPRRWSGAARGPTRN